MNEETIGAMRLEIGNVANALRVLRKRVGGRRLDEAETVATLTKIEAMIAPLEAALWRADVLAGGQMLDLRLRKTA